MPAERDRPRDSIPLERPDGVVGREGAGVVTAATAVVEQAGTAGASHALPGVLADVPVAVLVIDRGAGAVTYANTAAWSWRATSACPSTSTPGVPRSV